MVDVTLADNSKLTATDRHPFWDATTASFTYAIDLHPGDQLREANGGLITITNLVVFDEDVTAYNLTVNGIHTYYAGTTPVLVHNSCGPISMDEAVEQGAAHVGGTGEMIETPRGNFQFLGDEFTNSAGDVQRNIARFDIQNLRPGEVPHLNLEVQYEVTIQVPPVRMAVFVT
jgi:Pretoxin HINT domain